MQFQVFPKFSLKNQLELDFDLAVKKVFRAWPTYYTEVMYDWYYALLSLRYTFRGGGGGGKA